MFPPHLTLSAEENVQQSELEVDHVHGCSSDVEGVVPLVKPVRSANAAAIVRELSFSRR